MSGDRETDNGPPDGALPRDRAAAGTDECRRARPTVAEASDVVVSQAAFPEPPVDAGPVRLFFDGCEFRVDSGELLRDGELVRIAPQPTRVLHLLAQRSGQVVSRRELCDSVWGDGTCVDFEEGLNYCIKQLRRALDDDASDPRFIETVHRRGYRFLCPVRVGTLSPVVTAVDERAATAAGATAPLMARLVVLELSEIGRELPYRRFGATLSEGLLCGLAERLADRWVVVSGTLERLRHGHGEPGPADLLLEGSVRADGEEVVVALRLSGLLSGRPLWSRRCAFPRAAAPGEACYDGRIVESLVECLVERLIERLVEKQTREPV
ncbi:MAG TPA: winged helix-turn-helix domain-containing protein [Thermoanaerobaculia bacterium]|nr:winged helix-turn-helix domain-containing protein [Thermoanaerobaculia bacterium]